jgi:hypothetical protein
MQAPPIIASAPRRPSWWWTLALPMAAVALVLFLFDPSKFGFYPRCTLYTTTGLYCPGCGSLRALHHLAHGEFLTALHYNLLLVVALPFVASFSARRALLWYSGKALLPFTLNGKWMIVVLVVFAVFTILRNIPIAPFNWLAPP